MTVKISKPAVNLREELNELKKPTGVAGEAMLRAETVAEQQALIGVGRRNLIINGDFQVSQRGDFTSSQTLGTSFQFYVDRWKIYAFSNDLGYIRHFLDQSLPDGSYANTLRITSEDSDLLAPLVHNVEDHKIVWGRAFTLSFWYKSTSDNMYNLWNGTTQTHFLLPNTMGTWVKYEKTYKFPENGANLRIEFYSHGATFYSGAYLELANIQLELGSVATPFEHRSYGEELALCQRYFNRLGGGAYTGITTGMVYSNTSSMFCITYPVPMRAGPTISSSGLVVSDRITYDSAVTSFQPQGTSTTGTHFKTVNASNGASPRQAVALVVQNNGTGYMDFNAEL